MTDLPNSQSKMNGVKILIGLLSFSLLNCGATYYFTLPPPTGEPFVYWPKVFFSRLVLTSILLPILCLIALMIFFSIRRYWVGVLRSAGGIAAYFVTLFLILFLGYDSMASYTHLHSLEIASVTYHLGYISYLDGGASTIYLLCDQDQKNAVCTASFSECGIEDLTLAKSSRAGQLIVQWQSQIAYVYDIADKQLHRNEAVKIPCW